MAVVCRVVCVGVEEDLCRGRAAQHNYAIYFERSIGCDPDNFFVEDACDSFCQFEVIARASSPLPSWCIAIIIDMQ